jgi:PTH1 family peptidyl-tRNA hydrolase
LWLVVGLGNPGDEYQGTRHNAGFMLVDRVAARYGATLKGRLFNARSAVIAGRSGPVTLVEPSTFMNLSGGPVAAALKGKEVPLDKLVVVYDDLDLSLGAVRIRAKGSAGTHKGMKSIVGALGTGDFARIRIGIGPRPERVDAADFVLARFKKNEIGPLNEGLDQAEEALDIILDGGLAEAMTRFNRKDPAEQ